MDLYLRELKSSRKSLIIWILSLIFFIGAGMGKYITFAKQGDTIQELMNSMPAPFKKAMSMNMMNLTKVLDFYAYMFAFIMLFAAIYAMKLGATIILKEESGKTIEFLATKPISRTKIVLSKIFAGITNLIIFDLALIVISYVIIEIVKVEPYDNGAFFRIIIPFFIFELIYFSIGVVVSIKMKNIKKSTAISLGLVLITYMLSIASSMGTNFQWIKYVTPFRYYEPLMIFHKGYPEAIYFILSILIVIISLFTTNRLYRKKDFSV